jgi:hypothetical protein
MNRGNPQLLDPAGDAFGQGVIAAAVVQHHDLGSGSGIVQGLEQGDGIVSEGRDQHRQARLGVGPGGVLDTVSVMGAVIGRTPSGEG